MLKVVHDAGPANARGASRGNASLQAEVAAYIEAHKHEVDENGRRLVVGYGILRRRRRCGMVSESRSWQGFSTTHRWPPRVLYMGRLVLEQRDATPRHSGAPPR